MKLKTIFLSILSALLFQSCASAPLDHREPAADVVEGKASAMPRTRLWELIQSCVSDINSNQKPQDACLKPPGSQDLRGGVLVIKDIKAPAHFLLVPTTQVTGLEDTQVLLEKSPDYWGSAWAARGFIASARQKEIPDHFLGLAVNPRFARSQDQLHIHMDCVFPEVIAELNAAHTTLGSVWSQNTVMLAGVPYHVLFVSGDDLKEIRPFKILAQSLSPSDNMGQHTLGVIKADPKLHKGFYLLERGRTVDDTQTRVHAEDLMDMSCRILDQSAAAAK